MSLSSRSLTRPSSQLVAILAGHSRTVQSVAFSFDGKRLASASLDNTIRLWDVASRSSLTVLQGHSAKINSVAFSPDGSILASASSDKTIRLWECEAGACIALLKGHSEAVYSVMFSPDGSSLVSASMDKYVRLWDNKTRALITTLRDDGGEKMCVAFSPDGASIAAGSADYAVRLWEVRSWKHIATMEGHSAAVYSLSFSPDGSQLASGSGDATILLWNVASKTRIATLNEGSSRVSSVAFSLDGIHLASASADMTIRLWDVSSRALVARFEGHAGPVYSVAFAPDGAFIASGSGDSTVNLWSVVPWSEGKRTIAPSNQRDTWFGSHLIDAIPVTPNNQQGTSILSSIFLEDSPSVPPTHDISSLVSLAGNARIGSGGFWDLFLGVHKNRGKVALKRPHLLLDDQVVQQILDEVDLWRTVSHPFILPFLGMCRAGAELYMVSPYVNNGDLMTGIKEQRVPDRIKLLYEVSEALTHLHYKGIVHGNIKARKIMLSDEGSALLRDFGLAKALGSAATSTESKGTSSARWMAPELFQGGSRTRASDVYSFGMTIAEVLSGQPPYPDITESLAIMFHVVYKHGKPSKRPLSSPEGKSYAAVWEIAEKCWATEVKDRPSMAQVLAMLFPFTQDSD